MRIGERREPGLVLLFTILTCWIYYLWWLYTVSREMQEFLGESDVSPGTELLLNVLTCGFYNIYWDYKCGKKIVEMQARVGLPRSDNSVLYLVLDLLGVGGFGGLGLLCPALQQAQLNEIWDAARSAV